VPTISPRTVGRILDDVDLQPHRTRYWRTAPGPRARPARWWSPSGRIEPGRAGGRRSRSADHSWVAPSARPGARSGRGIR
jgi:hypothetical protein